MITRSKSALPAAASAAKAATTTTTTTSSTSKFFKTSKASLTSRPLPLVSTTAPDIKARGARRSKSDTSLPSAPPAKRPRRATPSQPSTAAAHVESKIEIPDVSDAEVLARTVLPYPTLTFSLDEATAHLCRCDPRFRRLVDVVPIRTYEELSRANEAERKELDLYRTLSTSILGQQISWLAARSILYKFCRVFDPSMPPTPDFVAHPRETWPFPTPRRVLENSDSKLREAGLSYAKIRYIKDLALRFCDGRLDIREVVGLDQEAIIQKLCEVKGVGRWTSEMILMFAMRAPDILPAGDLGVQKGMINFFLSGREGPRISVKKRKPVPPEQQQEEEAGTSQPQGSAGTGMEASAEAAEETIVKAESNEGVQQQSWADEADLAIPEGEGLSRKVLEMRLKGNKIKGQYLTPKEMDCLAEAWRPYRSVACMYMWALVDA
ncbi:uncharacterized protein PFL1_06360 [Pseudozyma flocculosa PF-1]|uniref:Related to MAG1 - 3-methyl-adenine DNA glycosylase n=2 Tax=Pseudozyma flocculosa TaxID=84751 RepID=A0A5C3F7N2_9BASI|nr:uncharacterized protein PFL1_06360 [Pseudozyma flocculosa PF-1]EPQ26152.1 hypothetical protein PFL1_06360 [Pseudozyma flocculosa PF-1]SPO40402.1 related to MAG1 - 3-methyl-adenine DNA glycosylase [Pseudozyma flocculosa]